MLSQKHMWGVWIGLTLLALALLAFILFKAQDKTFFMPGPLTHGHHQIEMACDVCHTSPMGGSELLQDACIDCHGDQRKKPMDSHPKRKFTDPRNANLIENINVLECITCHQEHRPGITQKGGYTQP
ncbi:MAG TPA: NrfA- nitrite reduction protein, partial [Gammaproteobacteria bacterium]|nr:NrfA- nitrite reduction protein [Gammaproteobacteria bacterium]